MLHKSISIIHQLRVYFLLAIIIVFFASAGINPVDVGIFYGSKVGSAVGMSSSVAENPFNKLALDLKNKENSLSQKEQALNAREAELNSRSGLNQTVLLWVVIVGIFILFILIIINFILDYRRRKNEKNIS
ncbi:MAG: hypothetical protein US93_C0002G0049 [Candidatus Falkowbacteria bacterium GW2011_GWD2_38_42]|uniref:Uncharacterized protein n=1 Tax=Candidatus Falkowbacteria bacterium GW2011_GWE1_38_31 TaxID=1618638 RepID=A0A0G0JX40_9BACT|nr:MAG: hypothetical protein US73_C0001G0049 [Candidatus Falkowbacteria bacterium GW2011_GWF2_38_1205]KKQ64017.1 MAG: hypothetical protein US84_C0002G0049 [Candidatus Falkowbacteria bacterium GW2011_GWF1_38_22]KKQ66635.1 MAG: hypothetical protein US87_C0001G0156 [Candidatus Falkowbacteria bacterium GW2011_GWE2_38_254]KKQ71122.1 MAG: hypothetical protein US91_C0001G0049 [Candidatus Falkowbacteria bacterium GW2011_GWE1_38_31]KKQ73248.1 MAG: hypothetical protein US93_C0002G0049 [Candidatus Falkowb